MRASSEGIRSRVQRGSLHLSGFFALLFAVDGRAAQEADFAVAARLPPGLPLPSTWPELALNEWAADAFQRRRARFEGISSVEDVHVYQRELRQFFLDQLGPWPERTPLHQHALAAIRRPRGGAGALQTRAQRDLF